MKIFLLIMLLTFSTFASDKLLPEATVAVVNGMAITEDELDKEVGKELPRAYYHSTLDEEKLEILKKNALISLIEKTLLYQYALSKNISVSDSEVEDIIEILVEGYGSRDILERALKQIGHSYDSFFKAVKKDEVLKKLFKSEIEYNISDDVLQKYYESNSYKFKEPEKIKVRLIHVRNDPTDPDGKKKAKLRADEAIEKLKNGDDFADIASEYSNAMSRINGGDMGYLHRGRLDKAVENEAFSMDVNETSEIIEKDIGYFIIKVEDKIEPNQLSYDEVKTSLNKELKKKEEDKRKEELLDRLKSTAVIIK